MPPVNVNVWHLVNSHETEAELEQKEEQQLRFWLLHSLSLTYASAFIVKKEHIVHLKHFMQ